MRPLVELSFMPEGVQSIVNIDCPQQSFSGYGPVALKPSSIIKAILLLQRTHTDWQKPPH